MVLGKGLGEGEIHEMTIHPSETSSDASQTSTVLARVLAPPAVSQSIGAAFIPACPALASQVLHTMLIL